MSAFFRLLGPASLAAAFLLAATHSAAAQTYTESVLYDFCSQSNSQANCTDGENPQSGVIQASDGNFYGVMSYGGNYNNDNSYGNGTIFKITPSGTLTTLYSFCSQTNCTDGTYPTGLVQGTDGNFYGTTTGNRGSALGNNISDGTVFKITPSGVFTTLYYFCSLANCADGSQPGQYDSLVQGIDGNFYGTTAGGGNLNGDRAYGNGTVFKITPSGKLTTLYSFCSQANCADGFYPAAALVQGTDGNFYGATQVGGANYVPGNLDASGTIFKVTPSGVLTTLYNFCSQTNCADGILAETGLVEGADGNFYSTTPYGGNENTNDSDGNGTVFKITPAGSLTVLYRFCGQAGCADGSQPRSNLALGTDGNFYSTTILGGNENNGNSYGNGTMFKITPAGILTTLYSFCSEALSCPDGTSPIGGVLQGADGNFYSTSLGGGNQNNDTPAGNGTIFELAVAPALQPPVQLSVSSSSVSAGATFTLTYTVTNATSDTLKYCFATNNAGNATWSGVKTGKTTAQTASQTASSTNGTYTYALTCGGMESGFATLTVTGGKNNTAASVTAAPNPATVGQKVTLTATVTHSVGSAVPTGTVAFSVDGTEIGTGMVNTSGLATLSASTNGLAPGSYPVVATYSGDTNYDSSASAAATVTLNKAPTAMTLTASPNPVAPPLNVTLTATVKRSASGATGTPGGTVTFYYDSAALGTVGLTGSGVASVSASSEGLAAAKYPITAKYNGDASDAASSSAVTVTVK